MRIDSSLVEQFERDGFAHIKGLFAPAQVAEIEAEYRKFVEHDAPSLNGRDINFADADKKVINSIHRLHFRSDGFFTQLLGSPELRGVASQFLRDDAVGMASEMFAKPAGKGLPSPAHQDNFYWCLKPASALTIWTALDTCNQENGGLSYLRGSHKLGLLDHVDSHAPGSSQTIADLSLMEKLEQVCVELQPGDALVHDCLMVHWSAANTSGRSRRGMTLQYRGARAAVDPVMHAHYTQQLERQLIARGQLAKKD